MRSFLGIVIFTVALVLAFVYVGRTLTRLTGETSGPSVSGEVSVEAGEDLFWGKGKCSTCHSIGTQGSGIRCPNLGVTDQFPEPIGLRAAARAAELKSTPEQYIFQSLYDPAAYVVSGFSSGVMTPVHKPPMALSDDEILAISYYLLSLGGDSGEGALSRLRTAQEPFRSLVAQASEEEAGFRFPMGDADHGRELFAQKGCIGCHRVGTVGGAVGPDLTGIGDIQSAEYIAESILEPSAVVVQGAGFATPEGKSIMPPLAAIMTAKDLMDLVAYLAGQKAPSQQTGE